MKQHYVPQFYFKNFGEIVFCLDKTIENIFPTPTKNMPLNQTSTDTQLTVSILWKQRQVNLKESLAQQHLNL